ncbi:hypothetical protein A2V80_01815 [Candidatus Woesebacteria bacterium RBG_16_39_8b]|uniref:Uncharacterized protein n=1 Tax=Candidatus Woesebacteria bacterium RBG_16_39_8b TaxID=1802482 RepID=A0A1F7XAH4_9BACT|nr:MAG: hypothetical protein A2V80_01815 [Candidatus Woesebacteria bacterium RBG_16_39_8b]
MILIQTEGGIVELRQNGEFCLMAQEDGIFNGKDCKKGTVLACGSEVAITNLTVTVFCGPRNKRKCYSLLLGAQPRSDLKEEEIFKEVFSDIPSDQ